MLITAGTVKVGEAIWRAVAPWKRLKKARNKRRARLGKPLLPITEDDDSMLPNGTMTHTGGGIAAAGPIITIVLQSFGVASECSPESVAMGCITAAQMTGALITLGGALLAIAGRIRAKRRAAAEIEAAKGQPQT